MTTNDPPVRARECSAEIERALWRYTGERTEGGAVWRLILGSSEWESPPEPAHP